MKVLVKKLDGKIYFKLCGELDEKSSHEIRTKMDRILDSEEYTGIVLDMKELTFMDSTGIGVIIGRYKRLKPMGKDIYVINPTRQVDKIMYTTGLYQIIKKIG